MIILNVETSKSSLLNFHSVKAPLDSLWFHVFCFQVYLEVNAVNSHLNILYYHFAYIQVIRLGRYLSFRNSGVWEHERAWKYYISMNRTDVVIRCPILRNYCVYLSAIFPKQILEICYSVSCYLLKIVAYWNFKVGKFLNEDCKCLCFLRINLVSYHHSLRLSLA